MSQTTKPNGLFIVFEGGEGSGKSTQAGMLYNALYALNIPTLITHEPGDTLLGSELRQILLSPGAPISKRAEALLFAADRAEHVDMVIKPALERGEVVICDRYISSMMAYQGAGNGHDKFFLDTLCGWSSWRTYPDLAILLDVDPGIGLERAKKVNPNRFEEASLAYHDTVRQSFLQQAREGYGAGRWEIMDGRESFDELHQKIKTYVLEICKDFGHQVPENWEAKLSTRISEPPSKLCWTCDYGLVFKQNTDRPWICPNGHGGYHYDSSGKTWVWEHEQTPNPDVIPKKKPVCPVCEVPMCFSGSQAPDGTWFYCPNGGGMLLVAQNSETWSPSSKNCRKDISDGE